MALNPFLAAFEPLFKAMAAVDAERAATVVTGESRGVVVALRGDLKVDSITVDPALSGDAAATAVRQALDAAFEAWRTRFGASAEEQIERVVKERKLYCPIRRTAGRFSAWAKGKDATGKDRDA